MRTGVFSKGRLVSCFAVFFYINITRELGIVFLDFKDYMSGHFNVKNNIVVVDWLLVTFRTIK